MIGAIIGDIVGSIYEARNIKTKDFPLFGENNSFTDDSAMTIAITKALLECGGDYKDLDRQAIKWMREIGQEWIDLGYGPMFSKWLVSDDPQPYNSYGNGAAMRVSAVGWVANSLEEVEELSDAVTKVTHNHPEGLKGAKVTASCIYLALKGKTKEEIKEYADDYYFLDFTIDSIRDKYTFDVSCQGSVPVAIRAFFESTSFEDAIRNAISIGGDSDTLAAITGSIAEAYYGVPSDIRAEALKYFYTESLDDKLSLSEDFDTLTQEEVAEISEVLELLKGDYQYLLDIINEFEGKFGRKNEN